MAEPRFLEFLQRLATQLQATEPNLTAVRGLVAAALLVELGKQDEVPGADETPGVPVEEAVARGPEGRGSGAQEATEEASRLRQIELQRMSGQIAHALAEKRIRFSDINKVLVESMESHKRSPTVDARILLGLQDLAPPDLKVVKLWWVDLQRFLAEEQKEEEREWRMKGPQKGGGKGRGLSKKSRTRSRSMEHGDRRRQPSNGRARSEAPRPHRGVASSCGRVPGVPGAPGRGGAPGVPGAPRRGGAPRVPGVLAQQVPRPPGTLQLYSMAGNFVEKRPRKVEDTLDIWTLAVLGEETKDIAYHNGTHPRMLAAAACSDQMRQIVRDVQAWLLNQGLWKEGKPGVRGVNNVLGAGRPAEVGSRTWAIRIQCKHGRHRSVATAELLADFLALRGFSCQVTHYSLDFSELPHPHDRGNGCQECGKRPTEEDLQWMTRGWVP